MGYAALVAYTLWQKDKNMMDLSFDSELSLNLSQCTITDGIGHDKDINGDSDFIEGDHKGHSDIDSSIFLVSSWD